MRITKRSSAFWVTAGVVAVVIATALWLNWPGSTISRAEAIEAALRAPWNEQLPADRITGVKLIHRSDLPRVIGQDGATDAKPSDRVWVVVVKGELIPATMPGGPPTTYTVEVIRDRQPPVVELYAGGGPGNRPPQWDQLVDLESH